MSKIKQNRQRISGGIFITISDILIYIQGVLHL